MGIKKEGFWKEHFTAWEASGLTKPVYCEQNNISYQSFIYQYNRTVTKSKNSSLSFTEAKPNPAGITPPSLGLQLMFPNGIRIGIGGEINSTLLQTVLSIAGEMRC